MVAGLFRRIPWIGAAFLLLSLSCGSQGSEARNLAAGATASPTPASTIVPSPAPALDCPIEEIGETSGTRAADARGSATPEEAARQARSVRDSDEVRLERGYAVARRDGRDLAVFTVVREASGWFVEDFSICDEYRQE